MPLPFSMPSSRCDTDRVWLCSNGFLAFAATTLTDYTESVAELLSDTTRLAFLWDDLNPGAGGTVDAEVDANGVFHITFTGVPEFGGTTSNDVQVSLHRSGNIEVKYGSVGLLDALVGFSTGGGATDPGGIDLSNLTPRLITTGVGCPGLTLAVVDRPVLGTTPTSQVRAIRAGSIAGACNFGVRIPTPISLAPLGAPGCSIYASLDASVGFPVSGATATIAIPLPNTPAFAGIVLSHQAAVLNLGYNALGVATSNGVDWTLGTL
ncbi:MAG: hypothetical protein IPM29_24105 [Planctomycetes bacterium]|nr:hypothetical protein [Planctomycetota bacterium]